MATYRLMDFMKAFEIAIDPPIQERQLYPFTMQCAKNFFDCFVNESFKFDGVVRSILIYDGKENLPKHSYAKGWLFSQNCDELGALERTPKPVGHIYLDFGGFRETDQVPRIEASKL